MDSGIENVTTIGALIFVVLGLFEIVKTLVGKAIPNKSALHFNGFRKDLSDIRTKIDRLDDLHSPKDSDGVPLWYIPRSWGDTQKEIANCLIGVAENQRRTLEIIERIEAKQ